MSLVEKCWMVTSKISVIALLMITGIYFGKFVCPYIKKKKGAVAVSIVYMQFTVSSGLHSVLERPFSEANGHPFFVKKSLLSVC